jgi:hypothetical protein
MFLSRRRMLQVGAIGTLGLSLPQLLRAETLPTRRRVHHSVNDSQAATVYAARRGQLRDKLDCPFALVPWDDVIADVLA